jgi:hypothetical protein
MTVKPLFSISETAEILSRKNIRGILVFPLNELLWKEFTNLHH